MSILTISDPDLLKYGLISMIWKVNNDVGADPLHLDRNAVRGVASVWI